MHNILVYKNVKEKIKKNYEIKFFRLSGIVLGFFILKALLGEVSQYKSSISLARTPKDFAINFIIYFVASQFSAAFFTDIFSLSQTTFQNVSCLAHAVHKTLIVKSLSFHE